MSKVKIFPTSDNQMRSYIAMLTFRKVQFEQIIQDGKTGLEISQSDAEQLGFIGSKGRLKGLKSFGLILLGILLAASIAAKMVFKNIRNLIGF